MLKPPFSYYGGKQTLASTIVKLIPPHRLYCESFAGGAAVFFAKNPSEMEVINDYNNAIVKFYRAIKTDYAILKMLIEQTPNSRSIHRESAFVLKNAEHFSDLKVAWAVWVQTNMSFTSKMFAGYAYAVGKNSQALKLINKKLAFNKKLQKRFDMVDIESNDAIKVISSRDREDTFHYVDPPYYNSNCGHYAGYTLEDYTKLLSTLENVKGKFLLSSYPSEVLNEFVKRNGWYQHIITKKIVCTKGDRTKDKQEVLTANYDIVSMLKYNKKGFSY